MAYYLDRDEDDLNEVNFMHTHLNCACCKQEIEASEEVLFLHIVQAQQVGDRFEYYPVLKSDGDYKYPPLFIHLGWCWKDVESSIKDAVDDTPPLKDPLSVLNCQFCGSGIREWEHFSLAQSGEFYCSPRYPTSMRRAFSFEPWTGSNETTWRICIGCIAGLGAEAIEDWAEISQNEECYYCNKARCWRNAPCDCFCHEHP